MEAVSPDGVGFSSDEGRASCEVSEKRDRLSLTVKASFSIGWFPP
jgi:hypothetical protein